MKQVLQSRKSGLTVVRQVPAPPCPPGSVLVRNEFSVISSGTERARSELSQKSLLGKARERPDLVREVIARARREGIGTTRRAVTHRLNEESAAGYSSAGRVIEVGEHVRGIKVGDAVACAGGGHANHAEIVSVPANLCAKVPDGVPLEIAAFTTIAAIAMHGVRLADHRLGERAAVIGCGLVGQIAVRLLRSAGAMTIALDIDSDRVDAALGAGADRAFVIDDVTPERVRAVCGGVGVDQALVTAAATNSQPLELAAKLARDRGTVVLVGAVPINLPRGPLYDKELSFRVSRSYGAGRYDLEYEERGLDYPIGYVRWTEQRNMESVLDLQARSHIDLAGLIDEVVPVDEAERAYARLTGDAGERPRGGIVLAYGGSANGSDGADRPSIGTPHIGAPTAARREGPVSIGLIGPGGFASRTIVPALMAAGARLELVGGGSGPSAVGATRSLGFNRAAESEAAVIGDSEIGAVAICTRHASHARLAAEALRAGKSVFVEKPLALTEGELDEVMQAAQSSDAILAVGFNRRFAPLLVRAREFVSAAPRLTAAYRVSAGRIDPDHWVHDLSQGGGRIIGEVCHFVDTLTYVAGSPVKTVYADGYGADELPRQAHDNLVVALSFANGSTGSIVYVSDGSGSLPKERLEVFAGKRAAVLDDFTTLELHGPDGKQEVRERAQDKGHRSEIKAFVDGIRAGHAPVPLSEIANVSTATLAIVESMRTGLPVTISDEAADESVAGR